MMSNGRRALPALLALIAVAGCGRGDGDLNVPLPALEGAELLVVERIREATERIVRDPKSAAAWGRLGTVYDVNGFPAEAVSCYEHALELDPAEWRWPYFAGIALRESDPRAALFHFERALELAPDYAPLHFRRGVLAVDTQDLAAAEQHFERALELDPQLVNARLGLAHVAVARNDPAAALDFIERAVSLAPDEAAVHFHLAEVNRLLGRQDQAERAERVGRSSPLPAGKDGFATLHDRERDAATLREGVTIDWLILNGRRHLGEGRPQEAVAALRQAVEARSDSVDLRLELSRTLAQVGAIDEAVAEAERALALDGSRADTLVQMGEVLAHAGQVERASQALRQALEIDPDSQEARATLGAVLLEAGRLDEGIELLRGASAALPGNAEVGYNLAAALVKAERLAEAAEVARSLTERVPGYAPAHALLGTIHALAGRLEPSVAVLRRAIELAPDDNDARIELGHSLWELRRYAESIEVYAEAAARRPNDPEIARELAWSLATSPDEASRDGARAMVLAQRLCEQSQHKNPVHLETLAAAQAAAGSFESAEETAGRALSIVESTIAGLDPPDSARRAVLQDFASQLRTRQAQYRRGK